MRYPAPWLLPSALIFSFAHAAYSPAPEAPASSGKPSAPTPTLAGSTASPAASTSTDKSVPVTKSLELFNGKDLAGWLYIAAGQPADISKVAQVKDGVMVVTGQAGKGTGFLELPEVRENYQLHVEWRWTAENPKNNSGVLIHISPGPLQQGLWPVCFQFQTKTTRAGDFIVMATAKCAEITAPAVQADRKKDNSEKPIGEWNSCDIVVRGDTIECAVNGVAQNKITQCVPSSGKIGFQLEGYAYEMRNIKLSPLEPDKSAAAPVKSN